MNKLINEQKTFVSKLKAVKTLKTIEGQVAFFQVESAKVSTATEGVVAWRLTDHFNPDGI